MGRRTRFLQLPLSTASTRRHVSTVEKETRVQVRSGQKAEEANGMLMMERYYYITTLGYMRHDFLGNYGTLLLSHLLVTLSCVQVDEGEAAKSS